MVADALSRKPHYQVVQPLFEDGFNLMHPEVLCHIQLRCSLESQLIKGQKTDKGISHIKEKIKDDRKTQFRVDEKGVLWFQHRLVVLKNREPKNRIMDEAHLSKLSIHPGSSKMYQHPKYHFW